MNAQHNLLFDFLLRRIDLQVRSRAFCASTQKINKLIAAIERLQGVPAWNDVPRRTMGEVSSYVRLDLPSLDGKAAQKIVPPRLRIP